MGIVLLLIVSMVAAITSAIIGGEITLAIFEGVLCIGALIVTSWLRTRHARRDGDQSQIASEYPS